jgi:hypothetical protein
MNTTSTCSKNPNRKSNRSRGARIALGLYGLFVISALMGCTYSGGELLYMLGAGKGRLVEAQFLLTGGPVLILIDDPSQRIDWPPVPRNLFDELAQQLLKNKAVKKLIPHQTLDQLRQADADFSKRGCREVGERTGAEQVLWVEVQDFLVNEDVTETDMAAYITVVVKVINVLETKSASQVRLWPQNPRGQVVSAGMTGSEVLIAKTKDAISKELTRRAAEAIAKFFYEHRLGDFERE